MKKIMHVAEPFATGVLSFLIDLTKRQVEEYEIFILWGQRPLTPDNVEELFDKRIHLIKIDSFKGALGSVVNPKAYIDINKWYREIRPDIVHLHSSASGFIGRWSVDCGKTKVFYTPHGYSFLAGNGSKLKRQLFRWIEKVSTWRKSTTIACSKGEYEEAKKLSKRCTYINNGINLNLLDPYVRDIGEIQRPLRICTSGRILTQKNPTLFNQIAKLLPEAELTWVGEGELRTELTAENVKVTGWISREEALETLKSSDFFILPSLWEGLPISLLEAMYMKKICLVSNVIGNRDVIRTGCNGIVCETAEDYAEAIRSLGRDSPQGARLAEAAHLDVKTNYSLERMAQAYNEVYNK